MENPYKAQSKVSPQPDKNYRQISGEFLEAFIKYPLSPTENKIMLFIIHKTWGFKKKADSISLTQFQKMIPASRPTIAEGIKSLEKNQLIIVDRSQRINQYMVNKFYDTWLSKPTIVKKTDQLRKPTRIVKKTDQDRLSALNIQKKKETITKENNNISSREEIYRNGIDSKPKKCGKDVDNLAERIFKKMPSDIDEKKEVIELNQRLVLLTGIDFTKEKADFGFLRGVVQGKYCPEHTWWQDKPRWQQAWEIVQFVSKSSWEKVYGKKDKVIRQIREVVQNPNKYKS